MGNPPGYFDEYYADNKDEINRKRKKRYQEDPDYRNRVLQASRDYRSNKRAAQQPRTRVPRFQVPLEEETGDGHGIRLLSVGAFALALGRSIQSINHWEGSHPPLVPYTPYRDKRGFRFYTLDMIKVVMRIIGEKRRLFPIDESIYLDIRRGWEIFGAPVELGRKREGKNPELDAKMFQMALSKTIVPYGEWEVGEAKSGRYVKLFPRNSFAEILERDVEAIKRQEKLGELPSSPYRDGRGARLYTYEMMEEARVVVGPKGDCANGQVCQEIEKRWERLGVPLKAQAMDSALKNTVSK